MPKIKKPAKKTVKNTVSAKKTVKSAAKKAVKPIKPAKPAKKAAPKKMVASKKAAPKKVNAKPAAKKASTTQKAAKKAVKVAKVAPKVKVAAKKASAPPTKKAQVSTKKTSSAPTKKAVTAPKKANVPAAKSAVKTKAPPMMEQNVSKNKENGMTKTQNKTKIKPQHITPPPVAVQQPTVKEDKTLDTTMDDMDVTPYAIDLEEHDEHYMQDEQREHFRKILIRWKHQLMSEVDSTMGHMQEDGLSFPDPIDRAAQEEGFNLELRTRDRERKLIKKIEAALDMIETGEYGYCEDCGANIGVGRLEARPTATKCIDCKTYSEIREKQSGGA